ncbi:hypothetical protein ACFFIO_15765 [Citricoccus parietis]|uniref:Uncharacterized protein n=1 Tax=Citricoccus parietis TaxID=592307 RepID=A0ABV6FA62_9MICC
MRIKSMLQTTAVLGLAVVVGLLGVGGTWALWNVSAAAGAGTVQSANLVVDVNTSPMLTDGTSTTVALEGPTAQLTPDQPVYATLKLTNNSTATSGLTLRSTLRSDRATSDNVELSKALTVQSAAGKCADATFQATSSAVVAQGDSRTFCLRLSLSAKTPGSLSDKSATVTIPVHVEQVR